MTFNEYQQQALVTEAPITPEIRERFRKCSRIIYDLLKGYEDILWTDVVKKYVFYGRDNDGLSQLLAITETIPCYLPDDDSTIRLVHGWLGLASEVEELAEAILSGNKVNAGEEVGDFCWYNALVVDAAGLSLDNVVTANIAKLSARYPEKFTEFHAKNRNLKQEEEILSDLI